MRSRVISSPKVVIGRERKGDDDGDDTDDDVMALLQRNRGALDATIDTLLDQTTMSGLEVRPGSPAPFRILALKQDVLPIGSPAADNHEQTAAVTGP